MKTQGLDNQFDTKDFCLDLTTTTFVQQTQSRTYYYDTKAGRPLEGSINAKATIFISIYFYGIIKYYH
jgi:hypothetical protein